MHPGWPLLAADPREARWPVRVGRIELAASGRVRLDELVGARLPLEETEAALRMGHTDPAVLETIVAVS